LQSAGLRIGTRGSPLALVQAETVRAALMAAEGLPPDAIAVEPIRTSGDRIADRPLAEAGGKGLFTREIDEAQLAGSVDIAVHSAKDLPTQLADGLVIAACLPREDVRDAFISPVAPTLSALPEGALLGTSSLRRAAMALRARPDLHIVNLRGNVETRLRKLGEGAADATLLAAAGLARLGMSDRATGFLDADEWLPAVGQGVVAIVARSADAAMRARLRAIDDPAASLALAAERAYLAVLDGSCRTPIGGLARIASDRIDFRGIIVRPDGKVAHMVARHGPLADGERLAADAGAELARRGGTDFFRVA
jgi:hydroxymethylbilane synthase